MYSNDTVRKPMFYLFQNTKCNEHEHFCGMLHRIFENLQFFNNNIFYFLFHQAVITITII
jgi:hypothetical protein